MSDEVAKELETTLKGKLYLAPFNLINYVSVVLKLGKFEHFAVASTYMSAYLLVCL